jgi:hypothetical protein
MHYGQGRETKGVDKNWLGLHVPAIGQATVKGTAFHGRNSEKKLVDLDNYMHYSAVMCHYFLKSFQICVYVCVYIYHIIQCGRSGRLQATSGLRPLVTRPTQLLVKLLLVAAARFIFFTLLWSIKEKNSDSISSVALHISVTHAIHLKSLPQNVSYPGKNCVRYKLLQEKI